MMTMTMMVARMVDLTRWWLDIDTDSGWYPVMPATYVSATMDQAMRMAMAIVLMWTAMMGDAAFNRNCWTWRATGEPQITMASTCGIWTAMAMASGQYHGFGSANTSRA